MSTGHKTKFPLNVIHPFSFTETRPGIHHKTVYPFGVSGVGFGNVPFPTAYWSFDDVVYHGPSPGYFTAVDEIGGDRNPLTFATELSVPIVGGKFGGYQLGSGLCFGTSQIAAPTVDLAVTSALAISVWVKASGAGDGTWTNAWTHGSGTSFVLRCSPNAVAVNQAFMSPLQATPTLADWTHVFMVCDASGHYLYVNGVLADSNADSITVPFDTSAYFSNCEDAVLDELGLWVDFDWSAEARASYASQLYNGGSGLFYLRESGWVEGAESGPPSGPPSGLAATYVLSGAWFDDCNGTFEYYGTETIEGPYGPEPYTIWRKVGATDSYLAFSSFPLRIWYCFNRQSPTDGFYVAAADDPTTIASWGCGGAYQAPGPTIVAG